MNILVPLDGSIFANKALEIAIKLMQPKEDSLLLLHVVTNLALSTSDRSTIESEFSDELHKRVRLINPVDAKLGNYANALMTQQDQTLQLANTILGEKVVATAEKHARTVGVENVNSLIEYGHASKEILKIAKSQDIDMIVMGTRGKSDLSGVLTGSVSHRVAHAAECSVILVK